jgi:probable HAF family extracellular repeat protein
MRQFLTFAAGSLWLAGIAGAQSLPKYRVVDLGILPGGNFSQATGVNDGRLITGLAADKDGTQQAMFWAGMFRMNIGTKGLNSGVFGVNNQSQATVQAEVATKDPNNENFCAYGTGKKCLPYLWNRGALVPLPLLGGNNGTVGTVNNRGEAVGIAETVVRDANCPAGVSLSGTGPQVLNFQAVMWGPAEGQIRTLRPLAGDMVGMAIGINDKGQAVGATGTCANTTLPPLAFGAHAVLWEADGTPRDLGNLGTTALNMALAVNNSGDVVGVSSLYPDSSPFGGSHAFLWTKQAGAMRDLGTLPGDVVSVGQGINDAGQVVGMSFDEHGNPRPFLWQNGVMRDLNDLVVGGAQLYLLGASINASGTIAGFGVTEHGDVHAFVADPVSGKSEAAEVVRTPMAMPESLRQMMGDGRGWFTIGMKRRR